MKPLLAVLLVLGWFGAFSWAGSWDDPPREKKPPEPPRASILSGQTLNESLIESLKWQSRGKVGPDLPLTAELLGHLNVMRATSAGEITLLRRAKKLPWPRTLREAAFEAARKRVETLFPKAVQQAKDGEPRAATVRELGQAVEGLGQELLNQVDELAPWQYIESKRFHKRLEAAVAALGDKDVRQQLEEADALAMRGRTVAKLVRFMADKGLRFAPAVEGDEDAYEQLHRALATYAEKIRPAEEGK
jgi:hypothetical protein